jgi:O-antigen/teichoic acid export membrane protein
LNQIEAPAPESSPAPAAAATKIARNAFHLVLGQVAMTAMSIVLNAALARSLGPAKFGLLYLVTSMTWFAYVFVEWGQGAYLVREVARLKAESRELFGTAMAFRIGAAPLVGAATLLVGVALGYDQRTLVLAAAMFAVTLPVSLAQGFGLAFRGHERMDLDAKVTVLTKGLVVALTFVALGAGGEVLSAILVQAPAGLAGLAVAMQFSKGLGMSPLRASRSRVRELAVEGAPLVAMNLAVYAQPYLDAIVLSKLSTDAVVGWYGGAKLFMNALIMPASILGSAAYPRLSVVASDRAQFGRELRGSVRPLFLLGALATVGTYLFAGFAVNLVYSARGFGPAVLVLQFFAPVLLLFFFDMVLGMAVMAVGKARQLALAKLVAVALSTTLDWILIPICESRLGNGGVGIVISFGISELVMLAAAIALLPRGTLDRSLALDLGRALLAGAGTLAAFKLIPGLPPLVGAPVLIALPICVFLFAGLAWALRLLRAEDIELLKAAIRRRRGAST